MSHEFICSALGVPADRWPPDHYALLGLRPGEVDGSTVEERVLDRMERLRPYQLAHPDEVTDAMNRLAQALNCLSDPAAKAAYDATLGRAPKAAAPTRRVEAEPPAAYPLAPTEPLAVPPIVPPTPPRPKRDDPRRRLYRRLAANRRLLAVWRAVGEYVGHAGRRLRPPEAIDFVAAMLELRSCLADEAALLNGVPGKPGAVVAALARQPLPLSAFRHLKPEQRAEIAEDWQAGLDRLTTIYTEIGAAVRRPHGTLNRRARIIARSILADRLDLLMIVLGLAALALAIWRTQ
jgi:hypothetical protein